jgi:hypothetical protein
VPLCSKPPLDETVRENGEQAAGMDGVCREGDSGGEETRVPKVST